MCLLGIQSQVVRDKMVAMAFSISICIGMCELTMLKLAPSASFFEGFCFILGGGCGIVSSIYLHTWMMKKVFKKEVATQ